MNAIWLTTFDPWVWSINNFLNLLSATHSFQPCSHQPGIKIVSGHRVSYHVLRHLFPITIGIHVQNSANTAMDRKVQKTPDGGQFSTQWKCTSFSHRECWSYWYISWRIPSVSPCLKLSCSGCGVVLRRGKSGKENDVSPFQWRLGLVPREWKKWIKMFLSYSTSSRVTVPKQPQLLMEYERAHLNIQ